MGEGTAPPLLTLCHFERLARNLIGHFISKKFHFIAIKRAKVSENRMIRKLDDETSAFKHGARPSTCLTSFTKAPILNVT